MTRNLGSLDRVLRFFIGLVLIAAPLANIPAVWSSSAMAGVVMVVGTVLVLTSLFKFCPLYRVLGISTCEI